MPASSFNPQDLLPRAFQVMVKPRGSICNLDCQYCYYLKKEKLYPDGSFRMSEAVLEEFTRQYIEAQRAPEITFAWQGGEPALMGIAFFQSALRYQAKYRKPGMNIQNTFQTNGTLLDDDWGQFFHDHHFLVGISLDGPQAHHDVFRQDKGGASVYQRVLGAVDLLKKFKVDFNTLTCVHAANADHGLEIYRFLRDETGSRFMQFIPIVERDNETGFQEGRNVTRRSVSAPKYGQFLIDVFDEWVRQDIGRVYVQIFDASLAAWAGQHPGLCVFEETCGQGLAMEFNGDVYSCDHFVEPGYLLGRLSEKPLVEMVSANRQTQFGARKKNELPRYCRQCEVGFICHGGCPKDRLQKTPEGEPGLNYLCAGYRAFFNYVDRPMRQMAALLRAEQAPAEVMRIYAGQTRLRDTAPTAPCPCGSGRAADQCHRAPGGYKPAGHAALPPVRMGSGKKRH